MSTLERWPLTLVLERVSGSVDFPDLESPDKWLGMISYKAGDLHFGPLVEDIEQCGIEDPICITEDEDGWWKLGNGHHRLVAALLLGLDDILVDTTDWMSLSSMRREDEFQDMGRNDLGRLIRQQLS